MNRLVLRKGNYFNQLSNMIDENLLDSSQYDLEVTVGNDKRYYRVRYISDYLEAFEVTPSSFFTSIYHTRGTQISEIANFKKTDFFWKEFPYKDLFEKQYFKEGNDRYTESHYSFLQRITSKKNINKWESVYQFLLPTIDIREKFGVLSYNLNIDLVRNRYYIVFFIENVVRGFFQQEKPQYLIYDKKEFLADKVALDNDVINLAIENNYPLNLLKYAYVMSNGNKEIIDQFFKDLDETVNYKMRQSTTAYILITPNTSNNKTFENEIYKYINQEIEDIDYSYSNDNKKLIYKK